MAWSTGQVMAAARMNAQGLHFLGGNPLEDIIFTALTILPSVSYTLIDGTGLSTPNAPDINLWVTSYVSGGTGSIQLWNATTNLAVGSVHTFTNTGVGMSIFNIAAALFASGANYYYPKVMINAVPNRAIFHSVQLSVR